jgi:hypothetical protein
LLTSKRRFSPYYRLALSLVLLAAPGLAATITGTVTNKTNGRPAAGDTVTLIRLSQGMQEAGHTTTDARGHYKLDVNDDGIHLVRVTHDKANYFQPVEPGQTTADVDVYSAAAKVPGVVNEAEVLHIQSDPSGNAVAIVASFFVKNTSSPPRTQFSDHAFEFYLPPGAVIEGSVALGPGAMSMPVRSAPVPLGDPDHYAFIFPIRPCAGDAAADQNCGETRFQVTYRVPYTGSLSLTPRIASPTENLAVMLPKSMSFKPAPGANYATATDELNAQAFVARNVQPNEPLGFTVSGTGQLPRDTQAAQQSGAQQSGAQQGGTGDLSPAEASARQRADTKPGVGLNNPLDSQGDLEPWAKYKWWILGGLGLALATGAGIMMKGSNPATAPASAGAQGAGFVASHGAAPSAAYAATAKPTDLLQALKDELFALETDRLSGQLSETEYAEQRSALETVLQRALARKRA